MSVPVGSTLERVYYTVPDTYTVGKTYSQAGNAIVAALERWASAKTELAIRPPVWDERWVMLCPDGTVVDVMFQRHTIAPARTRDIAGQSTRQQVAEQIIGSIRQRRQSACWSDGRGPVGGSTHGRGVVGAVSGTDEVLSSSPNEVLPHD